MMSIMGDTFQYALTTAGVGMGIVFSFLLALSLLMYLMRALLVGRPEAGGTASKASGEREATGGDGGGRTASSGGAETTDEQGVPRWAVAGAVAYLLAEEQEHAPRAAAWTGRIDSRRWEVR